MYSSFSVKNHSLGYNLDFWIAWKRNSTHYTYTIEKNGIHHMVLFNFVSFTTSAPARKCHVLLQWLHMSSCNVFGLTKHKHSALLILSNRIPPIIVGPPHRGIGVWECFHAPSSCITFCLLHTKWWVLCTEMYWTCSRNYGSLNSHAFCKVQVYVHHSREHFGEICTSLILKSLRDICGNALINEMSKNNRHVAKRDQV